MQRQVSFVEAIQRGFNNYANFNGRASRSEYWFWYLFTFLLGVVIAIVEIAIDNEVLGYIVSLALLLPNLAVTVRRLHDIGKAGGWIFISLIPIVGWIILLVWEVSASEPTPNRFGPVPNVVE